MDGITALGGPEATLTLKSDASTFAALPLTRTEREAATTARSVALQTIMDGFGMEVAPALLALAWLGLLRTEGGKSSGLVQAPQAATLAQERTRVRSLIEAAEGRDFFALLGVSEWSARGAALDALEARRSELAGLRARHPDVAALGSVASVLDEVAGMLADTETWERYISALRARGP